MTSTITFPAKRSRASTFRQGPSYFPIPMPPALCVYPQVKPHITTYETSITAASRNMRRGQQSNRCRGRDSMYGRKSCRADRATSFTGSKNLLQLPTTASLIVGTTVEYPPQPVREQLLLYVDGEPAAPAHPSAWLLILRYAAQTLAQHHD